MEHDFKHEQLPSSKMIMRHFGPDGSLVYEQHTHGILEIGIRYDLDATGKPLETYFSKRRMVGRRTYEKARVAYPDMPAANQTAEDFGASLLRGARRQQRRNQAEAAQRLAQSEESRFPRPPSTNWLRGIASGSAHLVIFASRDWKLLAREWTIPTGKEWLDVFGFSGTPGTTSSVMKGLETGFEVPGDRAAMLDASQRLLKEVIAYVQNPPEISRWSGSIRPRPKPRKPPSLAWPTVLPPLIEFLSKLQEPAVKIFNHHR